MPQKFKDDEGNEVEAYTQEEIDKRVEEAKSEAEKEYEEKNQEVQTQLETEQAEKERLEKEMQKAADAGGTEGGGDPQSENFKTLKQALDKKDEEIENLRKETKEVEGRRITDYKEKLLDKYAGEDEDLRKKIEHNYDNVLSGVETKSEKDVESKLVNAYKLSADDSAPNPLDVAVQGSPTPNSAIQDGDRGTEFTQNEVALGEKLGITKEEREKYGPKLQSNSR